MTEMSEHLVHTVDEFSVDERRREVALTIVATAVSGATVRTTPETLVKWAKQILPFLKTGA